jgi:pimeloyl-ACP methyl ester carboxylesterase
MSSRRLSPDVSRDVSRDVSSDVSPDVSRDGRGIVERWTTRSGIRIRYLDNAPPAPAGLPILFSPGLSDLADEYREMLEFFAPRRVIVVEVRGRGQSEAPAEGYSVLDHMSDLAAVLDEEHIERFHLMTFSRGTSWGLELALTQPHRLASMSIGDYKAFELRMWPAFADDQMASRFRGKPMTQRIQRHVLDGLVAESRDRQLWDRLGDLPCPLLVAQPGNGGGLVSDEVVGQYRQVRPDVEVVVVPDASHDIFRPDRLFYPKAVAGFIAERCPGL